MESKRECAEICRQTNDCTWFSFDQEANLCFAMETCIEADFDYSSFYSGIKIYHDFFKVKLEILSWNFPITFEKNPQKSNDKCSKIVKNRPKTLKPFLNSSKSKK